MIRVIRLFFLFFIFFIGLVVIVPYLLIQTEFGARYASKIFSSYNNDYSITVERVAHSIIKPEEITLENVVIQNKSKTITYLAVNKLVIGLKKSELLQFHSFAYLLLEDGYVDFSFPPSSKIDSSFLQLKDVSLIYSNKNKNIDINFEHVYGGMKPFSLIGDPYQFEFTSKNSLFNEHALTSVLVQGFQRDGVINVTNLGGNIDNGFFVSKLKILPDYSLDIAQLKINKINFQSILNPQNISGIMDFFPKINIQQFSLIDSSVTLPKFSIEKGNIEASNLQYDNNWLLKNGSLVFNADTLVFYDNLFLSPLIRLHSNNDKIIIDEAMTNWNKGNLNFTGSWQDNHLRLNKLIVAGVRYEMDNQLSNIVLPEVLEHLSIDYFMILPSLIIDTNPNYPFVFNNFEASGTNVDIVRNGKLNLYAGSLLFKAEQGSFRGVAMKYPDLKIQFSSDGSSDLNFNSLLDGGVLESTAKINPIKNEFMALNIKAYNIDSTILEKWQLAKSPTEIVNFTANLHGLMLPFGLSGIITANDINYNIEAEH